MDCPSCRSPMALLARPPLRALNDPADPLVRIAWRCGTLGCAGLRTLPEERISARDC